MRTQLRRRLQDDLAVLGARLAEIRRTLAATQDARAAVGDAVEAATLRGTTADELHRFDAWEASLASRAATLTAESARVAEEIVHGRDELVARRREERKLERLRERALARHETDEAHAEAVALDDLAMQRAERLRGETR
jgi:flagellar export protein FliJ